MHIFSAILAGGNGTRFWPLSRESSPKQLLNISGNDVMINETIKRCSSIIPKNKAYIVTADSQSESVKKVLLPEVPRENILLEPSARNTAPSILFAALKIKKLYGDGIMCVFPSDQHINDNSEFENVLKKMIEYAKTSEKLITIGITPTFPSTGYGYIKYGQKSDNDNFFKVDEFCEKPVYDKAKTYIENGNFLWNSGIFVFKVSTIIDNFNRYLPRIYNNLMRWYDVIGKDNENEILTEVFLSLHKISIDYGILERSDDVVVIPGDFGWSDVGSWDSLGALFPPDKNKNIVRSDKNILLSTSDCIIYSDKRLIATNGLNNLIIVSTDDALMICEKSKAQDVRKFVDVLSKEHLNEYL